MQAMNDNVSEPIATNGSDAAKPAITEKQMREEDVPWPKSKKELTAYIDKLADQNHDYGTCVYAMSMAAVAAFNYIAHKLGTTGFQAGCATLDIVRRNNLIKGPFMIVRMEDELNGSVIEKAQEFIAESRVWLRGEARKRMSEMGGYVHPDVFHRWIELATFAPVTDEDVKRWNDTNPDDQITGMDWYDQNRNDVHFFAEKLSFLRKMGGYFPTEAFAEKHVEQFKKYGFDTISLLEGDVSKYDEAKEGCSFRIGMPTSLDFSREINGIKIRFSVDTEKEGSNGSEKHNFDFKMLEDLAARAKPTVRKVVNDYIAKAREAMKTK